jgi:molybdate transport repressor ModE-like protein
VIRIEIEPVWRFSKGDEAQSMQAMLVILDEIRVSGKITQAADRTQISYRHVWNLIEKWSAFFEAPLVERRQGHGTNLTPFGEKLVWASQRLRARLKPQLENLAQELETEIKQFLPYGPAIIRVHASHGFAVAKLRELLANETDLNIELRYVNNHTALVSLAHHECDLAGMHLPQGALRRQRHRGVQGLSTTWQASGDWVRHARNGFDGETR